MSTRSLYRILLAIAGGSCLGFFLSRWASRAELAQAQEHEPNGDGDQPEAKGNGDNGGDNPAGVVIPFGKYRGRTIGEVAQLDVTYVIWLAADYETPVPVELRQAAAAELLSLAECLRQAAQQAASMT